MTIVNEENYSYSTPTVLLPAALQRIHEPLMIVLICVHLRPDYHFFNPSNLCRFILIEHVDTNVAYGYTPALRSSG